MPKRAAGDVLNHLRNQGPKWLRRWWGVPCGMILSALPLLLFWSAVGFGLSYLSQERAPSLITAAIGFAVQQWSVLVQERQAREERQRKALEEIEQLSESLRLGDYARAFSLYRAFQERQIWGEWRDLDIEQALRSVWLRMAPSPLKVWVELCEERREPEIDLECIEALVWAWRLGERDAEKKLDETVSKENLCRLMEALGNDPLGRLLLRSPAIGKRLDGLSEEKENLGQERKECLECLTTLRQQPVRLPLPWRDTDPPADPEQVAGAIKKLGLQHNPFGPEQAELDPYLKKYGIWPRSLDRARGPRPALVFGPSGSGRTAAVRLLVRYCLHPPASPQEKGVFPVWLEPVSRTWPETHSGWLVLLGRAVAEALLQASALDPYALFEQETVVASAIAFLFSTVFGADRTEQHLRRVGLQEGARRYVLGEVWRWAGGKASEALLDERTSLDLIGRARPGGLSSTYMFLDLPTGLRIEDPSTVTASLACLLELALPLASRGVYLKVFLPEQLRKDLAGVWFGEPGLLTWRDDDLHEMLQRRLEWAGLQSLQQICNREARQLDPDRRLVKAAKGSPRELVRLGNWMLARFGNRVLAGAEDVRLAPEDLPQVR